MRGQRGSTVIEMLVAAAIGALIAIGFSVFFLSTLRLGRDMDAQAALQRQGTAVAEQLGRWLRLADGSPKVEDPLNAPETPACLPLSTTDMVLVIPDATG